MTGEEDSGNKQETKSEGWFSNLPFATRLEGYAKSGGKQRREKIKEKRKKEKEKRKKAMKKEDP